ncbi:hypothetical protein CEXT_199261 [Caerostris extrusa]|uniref:Secreted protein n=1 Tax=Caerostris extrusa TaxID=172846 RepID=A0AAV4WRK1_CAEEX|nr:hypothetical protein CEXT_199261 [Caerostris extrusa]
MVEKLTLSLILSLPLPLEGESPKHKNKQNKTKAPERKKKESKCEFQLPFSKCHRNVDLSCSWKNSPSPEKGGRESKFGKPGMQRGRGLSSLFEINFATGRSFPSREIIAGIKNTPDTNIRSMFRCFVMYKAPMRFAW